jgi:zinc transporter
MQADTTPNIFPIAGVVFAWAMPKTGKGYEIPLFEIAQSIEDPDLSIWLHLNLSSSQVQRWLEKTSLVPERVVEMIEEGVNLSRMERIEKLDDCLVMVMNDFHQEFGEDQV